MRNNKLDEHKHRQRVLEAIRRTGLIESGWKMSGLSESTLRRYRDSHPEFEAAVQEALQYWKIQNDLQYGAKLRQKAFNLLLQRIEDGSLSDAALLKILFEPVALLP